MIERDFFLQPTTEVAKQLLGLELISQTPEGLTSGRIVETEAYLGSDDPAAHSFRGPTSRTQTMFGEPGHAYVYFIYGMYTCINVVCGPVGTGHAVLIRALEPLEGVEVMRHRRGREKLIDLCSGPGKLTIALGISLDDDGRDLLTDKKLQLRSAEELNFKIATSARIGITKATDLPYRFYIKESEFVSRV